MDDFILFLNKREDVISFSTLVTAIPKKRITWRYNKSGLFTKIGWNSKVEQGVHLFLFTIWSPVQLMSSVYLTGDSLTKERQMSVNYVKKVLFPVGIFE